MEEVKSSDGKTVAIVVRKDFKKDGINFITQDSFPLQLGVNSYKKGATIKAHIHKNKLTSIHDLQEVILVKEGKTTVKLYDSQKTLLKTLDLSAGDLIFLASGGHGFEILEDTTLMEVKQGPYLGKTNDKEVFE